MNTIYIGSDHAGYLIKTSLVEWLKSKEFDVFDQGTHSPDSCDYPDYAHAVAAHLDQDPHALGILVCGSGNGICMAANKHTHIRAALCWEPRIAALARQHNNANVICLPARFLQIQDAIAIVQTFLQSDYEGGKHQKRIEKINL